MSDYRDFDGDGNVDLNEMMLDELDYQRWRKKSGTYNPEADPIRGMWEDQFPEGDIGNREPEINEPSLKKEQDSILSIFGELINELIDKIFFRKKK